MTTKPDVPLWRCVLRQRLSTACRITRASLCGRWNLPPDFVTLAPLNETARIIDRFNHRVFTHPLRPKTAMSSTASLPARHPVGPGTIDRAAVRCARSHAALDARGSIAGLADDVHRAP